MSEIPEQMSSGEKEEVIYDALHKTITNLTMEYDLSYGQIIAGLEIVKGEFIREYEKERFGS